jgi:hypothetical protein
MRERWGLQQHLYTARCCQAGDLLAPLNYCYHWTYHQGRPVGGRVGRGVHPRQDVRIINAAKLHSRFTHLQYPAASSASWCATSLSCCVLAHTAGPHTPPLARPGIPGHVPYQGSGSAKWSSTTHNALSTSPCSCTRTHTIRQTALVPNNTHLQ